MTPITKIMKYWGVASSVGWNVSFSVQISTPFYPGWKIALYKLSILVKNQSWQRSCSSALKDPSITKTKPWPLPISNQTSCCNLQYNPKILNQLTVLFALAILSSVLWGSTFVTISNTNFRALCHRAFCNQVTSLTAMKTCLHAFWYEKGKLLMARFYIISFTKHILFTHVPVQKTLAM